MRDRITDKDKKPEGALKFLYYNAFGAVILRLITRRWVSKLVGAFLNTRLSKHRIKRFIKKNGIDMSEYLDEEYKNFNAFFTRHIKPELRPFDMTPTALVSPCDSKLTVFPITEDGTFEVKGYNYTVETLLGDSALAARFIGGQCLVFRLTVTDYHRYMFFDGGEANESKFIKGRLHTVQPAALSRRRVFTENCREVTILETDNFGTAVQVEVGAMMVGRIVNSHGAGRFERGEEKGRFEFGGSTIIVLLEKGAAALDAEIIDNSADGYETVVKCGEKIGVAAQTTAASVDETTSDLLDTK